MAVKVSSNQIQKSLILFARVSIVIAMISEIINQRWGLLFSTSLIFILTYIPLFFEKRYQVNLPIELELIIIAFIYASLFLGEIQDYYTLYWWWDVFLHISSGIALGFAGFLFMFILFKRSKVKANPILIVIFAFSFAVAFGTIWEIFEFGMDQIFGWNMQKSGLIDTMWDLIVDTAGALVTSFVGYFYLKGRKAPVFGHVVETFSKENPKYFKK